MFQLTSEYIEATFLNLTKIFSDRFNIPIIEGVTAAAALVENLSKQDLKIKKFTKPLTRSNRLKI